MAVVRCERCDQYIDMDKDVEVFSNADIPGIATDDLYYVCFECLTDDEAEKLEE